MTDLVVRDGNPCEQRANDDHQSEREQHRETDDPEPPDARARACHSSRERKQCPRGDVVDRSTRHRERADRTFQHPPLDEDPREDRKRGDRHRDAHEQRKREVILVRSEQPVDRRGDEHPERHRERDARVRHERRPRGVLAEQAWVELHADEEEVEGETDLRRAREERHDVRREEIVLGCGPDGSEERRPEQNAGEDLPHHARLADLSERGAEEPCSENHRGDREHQPAEGLLTGTFRRLLRARARRRQSLGELRLERLPA